MKQVGEFHQLSNVRHAVLGIVPRTETGAADVHGVGAMQDGLAGDGDVARGGEQFEVVFGQ
ncbi:hypothetical protein D3C77_715660 [compost metagenome]